MRLGLIANVREVARVPSNGYTTATIPALNQLADIFVVDELAMVGGSNAFFHLAEKPRFMLHESLDCLLHQATRVATAVGGKPRKLGLQLRGKIHFHAPSLRVKAASVKPVAARSGFDFRP